MPEPERRRQQPDNLPDTLGDEQEAARRTDRPSSGKSVASLDYQYRYPSSKWHQHPLSIGSECASQTIGDPAQQYPGGIIGSQAGDPDVDIPTTNEETNSAEGGVFKPTTTSSSESTGSPGIDGTVGRTPRRSGAEEKMPEPERRQWQQPNNLPNALGDEQEAARRTDWPRSGKSVASSDKKRILKYCKQWHKGTEDHAQPWPKEGTFDHDIAEHTLNNIRSTYKKKKRQKREAIMSLRRVFCHEKQKEKSIAPEEAVPQTESPGESLGKPPPYGLYPILPAAGYQDPVRVEPKEERLEAQGAETTPLPSHQLLELTQNRAEETG
ncbi:hypothetical protein NDU88_005403 [Pleurodeles waltl]|uniref:Uncharacterized protein n=1 Tax=Pleurodeles waltl TaxID=8319 RepID=A0AAV7NMC4_PLEWA|nr:hypothetical protein NDU88_005403 [Pleurodeles waltl]